MNKHLALTVAWVTALSFAARAGDAPAPARCSLVVAETRQGAESSLVLYHIENGRLKSREALPAAGMELTAEHGGPIYGRGGGCIYLNRYVITRFGDVYDLEARKQLRLTGGDEFIACEDGKVILFNSGDFSSYDLKQGQLVKMDNPGKWRLLLKGLPLSRPAELSPDGSKSVVDAADSNAGPKTVFGSQGGLVVGGGKLSLCALDAKPKVIGEGFLCKVSPKADVQPQTPVLWLDNERILTQRGNGHLVALKLDGSFDPVADIEIQGVPATLPSLSRDAAGRIIYSCGDSYVIDPEKGNYAKMEWADPGDGFEVEVVKTPDSARIRYMGAGTGFDSVDAASAKTIAGHIALALAKGSSESRREIRVWSSDSKTWETLELGGNLVDIIGWVDDSAAARPVGN